LLSAQLKVELICPTALPEESLISKERKKSLEWRLSGGLHFPLAKPPRVMRSFETKEKKYAVSQTVSLGVRFLNAPSVI
jgi:hypothetical protein